MVSNIRPRSPQSVRHCIVVVGTQWTKTTPSVADAITTLGLLGTYRQYIYTNRVRVRQITRSNPPARATKVSMSDHPDDADETDAATLLPAVTRRDMLAASTLTLAGAVGTGTTTAASDPESVLLSVADLVRPAGETYVVWDGVDAPLLSTLRRTVPGFGSTPAAGRGFVARPGTDAPAAVESGAISLADGAVDELIAATSRWVHQRIEGRSGTVDVHRSATGIEFRTQDGDTLDVVHLHRAGGYLLVTIASGDPDAAVDPQTVVPQYVRTMRQNARR